MLAESHHAAVQASPFSMTSKVSTTTSTCFFCWLWLEARTRPTWAQMLTWQPKLLKHTLPKRVITFWSVCFSFSEPWKCASSFVRVRLWTGGRYLWWHFRSLPETFGYSPAGKLSCPLLYSPSPPLFFSLLQNNSTISFSLQANKQRDIQENIIESDAQVRSAKNSALCGQGCLCAFLFEDVSSRVWVLELKPTPWGPFCLCFDEGAMQPLTPSSGSQRSL